MPRAMSAEFLTLLTNKHVKPILLWELVGVNSGGNDPGEDVRFWTGYGELSFDSKLWQGVGQIAGIAPIRGSTPTEVNGMEYYLDGLPPDIIALALDEDYQNKPVNLYIGLIDSNGTIESMLWDSGRADTMNITMSATEGRLSLRVENALRDKNRAIPRAWTDADQRRFINAFDDGFDGVAALQQANIRWGLDAG